MADYIIGGVLAVLFVLAARSYFGRKYSDAGCCGGCQGCSMANRCKQDSKEGIDKL